MQICKSILLRSKDLYLGLVLTMVKPLGSWLSINVLQTSCFSCIYTRILSIFVTAISAITFPYICNWSSSNKFIKLQSAHNFIQLQTNSNNVLIVSCLWTARAIVLTTFGVGTILLVLRSKWDVPAKNFMYI